MSLTIEIAPELEGAIRKAAEREGLSPDAYVLESVAARLEKPAATAISSGQISGPESELLQRVNQSMDHIGWTRYHSLIEKRKAQTLSADEHAELINISDAIETANCHRIELLIELAELRQTTLTELMTELGIKPVDHG